jgi:mitogen-activated protein kinase kinase kinase
MYNFFGHRPPSELISNHLAEYFPSAKKKVLERTARNSTMRLGSGAPGMGESASLNMLQAGNGSGGLPGTSWSDEKLNPSSRLSMSSLSGVGSPRKKRNSSIGGRKSSDSGKRNGHQNSNLRAMSPPRTAIPEDPNGERTASIEVPRLSFSTDGGETLAYLDQPSSPQPNDFTDEKPPLLPPFASSTESLLDSFKKYSPESSSTTLDAPAPRLGAGGRRVSNASNSRLSMISQIRRSKDRSDTASMLTVDEITAHVESKRTSMIGGESDDGTEEFDELRNLALGARRPSRSETIRTFGAGGTGIQGSQDGDDEDEEDDGTEDGEEYESEEESDEEDYSEEEESEDDDEEDEEEEVVETAEDEHGKAFMSTGGQPLFSPSHLALRKAELPF